MLIFKANILQTMQQNSRIAGSRIVDFALIAILAALFWEGYSVCGYVLRSRDSIGEPLLVFASFLGVFYPFRPMTRAMWLVIAPAMATIVPTIGYHVKMRLTVAPGYEVPGSAGGLVVSYIVFVATAICWLVPEIVGWRLRQRDGEIVRRGVGLYELFALTGIVCVLLILFRDTFDTTELLGVMVRRDVISQRILRHAIMFGIPIWAAFALDWRIALVAAIACFAVVIGWHWVETSRLAAANARAMQLQMAQAGIAYAGSNGGGYGVSYLGVANQYTWRIVILVSVILVGRASGYRLVRDQELSVAKAVMRSRK